MKRILQVIAVAAFTFASLQGISQTRHRVNNTGVSVLHTTIASAQAAAVDGDILIVEHSDTKYDGGGTITITKKLTIYGAGYLLAENNPTDSTQADSRPSKLGKIIFGPNSEGSTMMGITVDSLSIQDDSVTVNRCRILGRVWVGQTGNVKGVSLSQNLIKGSEVKLIQVIDATNLLLMNNFIENNLAAPTNNVCVTAGTGLVLNNLFFGNGVNKFKNASVQNNFFKTTSLIDPVNSSNITVDHNISQNGFFNTNYVGNQNLSNHLPDSLFNCYVGLSADKQYTLNLTIYDTDFNPLTIDNPMYQSGADGKDMGMYGGATPYVISGMPPIPSIWFYSGPATGTQSGGTTVTVKTKTRK